MTRASGDFIAFIDDDEFPQSTGCTRFFETQGELAPAAVLGPVLPQFETLRRRGSRRAILRPADPSDGNGDRVARARSGNVLVVSESWQSSTRRSGRISRLPARTSTSSGGWPRRPRFVWCDEAVVFEHVPSSRCTRRYLLRRAALRGSNFPKHPTQRLERDQVAGRRAVLRARAAGAGPCRASPLPRLSDQAFRPRLAAAGVCRPAVVTERET